MKILNHLLHFDNGSPVPYKPTPNKGGKYLPQYLIMHFTGATSADSAINWFLNKNAQASAHLVIGNDGSITQMAPFNVVTWHAGKSQWAGLVGLNQHSIGIELANAGMLEHQGGNWVSRLDKKIIPNEMVKVAAHKNGGPETGWQGYSEVQLQVAQEIANLLVAHYKLKDVLGHEDIAPGRKTDPGPAFPMTAFRSKAMGRKDETLDDYLTLDALNIRSGPGAEFEPITKPLPKGTLVSVIRTQGSWSFVDVETTVHGLNDLQGWVATRFLGKK